MSLGWCGASRDVRVSIPTQTQLPWPAAGVNGTKGDAMDRSSRVRPPGVEHRRTGIAIVVLAVLLATLFLAATAGAGPRRILDTSALPTYAVNVNGSGASVDSAMAVLADRSGAWVAGWAGNANGDWDATLTRVTSVGTVRPLKRYDGSAHKNDAFLKIARGPNGTVYTAGWTTAANDKTDMLVEKWSSSGSRIWAKKYDGAAHGNDAAAALGVDSAGNVTVVGTSDGATGTSDYIVVRWSSRGDRKSVWRYDGSAKLADAASDVVVSGAGTAFVTGNIKVTGPRDAILTVKFSPSGVKLWQKTYLGTNSLGAGASAIVARPSGGIYVAGWTQVAVANKDALVLRYTSSGSPQAVPPAAQPGDQMLNDVAVTTAKRIVGVGYDTQLGNAQWYIAEWPSETGAASLSASSGSPWDDAFTSVAADSTGAYCTTGWQRTAAAASETITYRIHRFPSAATSGFLGVWNLGPNYNNGYAIAISGNTVYVVGSGYLNGAEAYNQTILIYAY